MSASTWEVLSLAWPSAWPYTLVRTGVLSLAARETITGRLQLEKYFDVAWPGYVFTRVFTILNFSFNGRYFLIVILIFTS